MSSNQSCTTRTTSAGTTWQQHPIRLFRRSCGLLVLCLLLWPASIAYADTFTVTNTDDEGTGSLRQAILDANGNSGADLILFSIGAGVQTIQPQTPLPPITDPLEIFALGNQNCSTWPPQPQVVLDGSLAGADVDGFQIAAGATPSRIVGFYINRFSQDGIDIGTSDVIVACNIIGLDTAGNAAANLGNGILIAGADNRVGPIGGLVGNVISGNNNGVYIWTAASDDNVVAGNFIGTDPTGLLARGNATGILTTFGATDTTLGGASSVDRNVISGNNTAVNISESATAGTLVWNNYIGLAADGIGVVPNNEGVIVYNDALNNRILANRIFGNVNLGIDLELIGVEPNDSGDGDSGANNLQNYPLLTEAYKAGSSAVVVRGTLNSVANSTYRIEIFANDSCDASGFGEGQIFLGNVLAQTDNSGNAQFTFAFDQTLPDGQQLTATATDNSGNAPGNTSEFSLCKPLSAQAPEQATLPIPFSDAATTPEDVAVTIDVLANDTDPNSDPLTLVSVGTPSAGTTQIVSNKILFTPAANFNGKVTFFYSVHDGNVANTVQSNVTVNVTPVNDPPTNITLTPNAVAENLPSDTTVGTFSVTDVDNANNFNLSLQGSNNDNAYFQILGTQLSTRANFDFEAKTSYTIRVRAIDPNGALYEKDLVITIQNTNDAPTAINLSNNRLDENQAAGATVGNFSSVDPDAGNTHTYALSIGVGSEDNALYRIEGATLKTNAVLDFEAKQIHSIRVRSTDNANAPREQIFLIYLNDVASPPDAPLNTLSYCSGNAITLISGNANDPTTRVLVKIDAITILNKTADSCTVQGKMAITSNGNNLTNLAFTGEVNSRNQFASSTIPDFSLSVAGLPLLARDVEIEYYVERPSLRITRPALQMPADWGGVAAPITLPTLLDSNGVKFGTGTFGLPTISTKSGFELELTGSLNPVAGGYQISADGSLSIPNIGKKKAPGTEGRTCTISAGVTIYAGAQGQTVMVIAAGDAKMQLATTVQPMAFDAARATDQIRLDKIRAGVSCDPGLAIGSTGLFLTSLSGEITLTPNNEKVNVQVEIETGEEVPGLGPVVGLDGEMELALRPDFQLDLGVALKVLSFQIAKADATITKSSFKSTINITAVVLYGTASINAWSSDGKFHFTGSGRMSIEIRKGSIAESCGLDLPCGCSTCYEWGFIPYPCKCSSCPICVSFPPFDTGPLAEVGVDVGEFTNGRYGFKGFIGILGQTVGFYVDERGGITFSNIDQYQLIAGPTVAALHADWIKSQSADMTINEAAFQGYTFLEDGAGNSLGVLIRTPLVKPTPDMTGIAQVTDVISRVNLLNYGDVAFTLKALGPLAFSVVTPDNVEITPGNFNQPATVGYVVAYSQSVAYEEQISAADTDIDETLPRLIFTPISSDPAVNDVDLQVDGKTIYYDVNFTRPELLASIILSAGEHTVALVESGTNTVILEDTVDLITDTDTSLVTVALPSAAAATQADSEFFLLDDDNSAPATPGNAKVRFFNTSGANLNMLLTDVPLFSNIGFEATTSYALVAAGTYTVEFRYSTDNTLASQPIPIEFVDGAVYTFFSADYVSNGYYVSFLMRLDASYTTMHETSYIVDQAIMSDQWEVKVVGDTDNIPYMISIAGPSSPPVLASITVDDSTPATTQVSWQLTSDIQPTRIKVYVNPGAISESITVTNPQGVATTQEIPVYEGFPVAEYSITDLAQLGGQLVTKVIDLSKLPSGEYHLWIRAEDGINPPVNAYASLPSLLASSVKEIYGYNAVRVAQEGYDAMAQLADAATIVIDHASDFPTTWNATINQTFDATADALYLEWPANPHPDVDSYRLYVGNAPLSPSQVITAGGAVVEYDENGEATGAQIGFTTLNDIQPTVTYYLSIEAVDTESGRTVRSQEVTFSASAGSFALTTPQHSVTLDANRTATVPISLNELQPLFYPEVSLALNLKSEVLGITSSFVGDVEGLTSVSPTQQTKALQINVDESVPDGRYPLVVTGYNGELTEILNLEIVVGDPPYTSYMPSVER